jgi:hypothetical protein
MKLHQVLCKLLYEQWKAPGHIDMLPRDFFPPTISEEALHKANVQENVRITMQKAKKLKPELEYKYSCRFSSKLISVVNVCQESVLSENSKKDHLKDNT